MYVCLTCVMCSIFVFTRKCLVYVFGWFVVCMCGLSGLSVCVMCVKYVFLFICECLLCVFGWSVWCVYVFEWFGFIFV